MRKTSSGRKKVPQKPGGLVDREKDVNKIILEVKYFVNNLDGSHSDFMFCGKLIYCNFTKRGKIVYKCVIKDINDVELAFFSHLRPYTILTVFLFTINSIEVALNKTFLALPFKDL